MKEISSGTQAIAFYVSLFIILNHDDPFRQPLKEQTTFQP